MTSLANDDVTMTQPTTSAHPSSSAPDLDTGPLAADDPRLPFAKAVALAGQVIASVAPGQLDDPTPCTEFDVRQLTGHLVGVLHRVAIVGRGEDALAVPLIVADGGDDQRWYDRWTEAAHEVQAVWSDPAILARTVRLPFAEMPGAAVMALYTSEVTVHTWDLASATGQQPDWDDAVVGAALAGIRRALPADREPEVPFAPVVPVGDDAPMIDRLVAWTGRRP
jgi:uncharacterized protein (TIGR03086 family)